MHADARKWYNGDAPADRQDWMFAKESPLLFYRARRDECGYFARARAVFGFGSICHYFCLPRRSPIERSALPCERTSAALAALNVNRLEMKFSLAAATVCCACTTSRLS